MKRYIILLFLLMSVGAYAQNHNDGQLPSWWNKIASSEKVDTVSTESDTILPVVMSRDEDLEQLIVKAVSPILRVVKQQYRLKKDGDFFGRNNKPHFGESFSLGVKVAGGTILQNEVLYPWLNDKDYKEVNEAGKYTPVLYESYQKSVIGGDYEKVDFELNTPYVKPVGKDSLLYIHSDVYSDFGLNMDTASGEKSGYMLWVYETDGKCDYKVEALNLQASVEATVIPMKTSSPSKVLGGVYVIPVNERPGTISFYLVGVASTCNNKDWSLKLLTKDDANINIIK